MKKLISILLCAALCFALCAGFAACRFDTDTPETPPGSNVDDEKNEDAVVNLTVGVLQGTYERNIMLKWKNAFQREHPEVGIDISVTLGAMDDIVRFDSAGQLPDICWTAGDQHSPYSQEYFVDLSELEGADAFFGGFYDALIETTHATATDDAVWFVPRDYNALVVYYNQTLFEAAGVALPQQGWTWTGFENTCAQLMASGQVLKAVEYDMVWPPFSLTMMANYGSKYFNDDGTIALRSDETQACFNMLQEFNTKYAQHGTGGGFAQYTEGSSKNIGMFIDVRPSLPEIAAVAAASGWKLGAVSFPNFKQADGSDGYVGVGCSGYAITQKCAEDTAEYGGKTKQEWAWKFLRYCMSEEGYEEAATLGVLVPAIESLADKGSWREFEMNGVSVNPDAFVRTDATPIFLNYYTMHNPSQHAAIITAGAVFWGNVKPGGETYNGSLQTYLQTMKDRTGIVE